VKFINRKEELKILNEALESERFEFYVLYGRRRIGKTCLVLNAINAVKDKKAVYYLAVEGSNIEKFKNVASKTKLEIQYVKNDFEAVFNFLKDEIVVIDEFPNLIKENPKIVSEFQRIVDVILKDTKTKLILLGSSISMMENSVLSYGSPLFGRKTGQIKLKSMKFREIKNFFPEASAEELVEIYGFADGVPFYLEKVQYPFWEWMEKELKRTDSFLKTEIDFLMKYEFSETRTYKKILEAISLGNTQLGEIKDYCGFKGTDITPYLKNLIETEFVNKISPLFAPVQSRKSRYYIKDNFVKFWFKFICPNISFIEEGIFSADEIKKNYSTYLGGSYEKICFEFLIENIDSMPFRFTKIGRQYGSIPLAKKGENQYEIDWVGINEATKEILFVECKWKDLNEEEFRKILNELKEKAKFVEWNNDNRKEYFGIIAKRIENKEKLRMEGFRAFDLEDFK